MRPRLLWSALVVALTAVSCADGQATDTSEAPAMPTTPTTATPTTTAPTPTVRGLSPDELREVPVVGRLVGWILDHRGDTSIVVSDGVAPELSWNPEIVRPTASTFKTIVLAAYARQVAAGRLDPDEIIAYDEIDRWLLEGTDGESHNLMVDAYGTADGVRLDDLAAAMMAFSTNTATDVLLDRIGRPAVVETADALGLPALATAAAPRAGAVGLLSDRTLGATVSERLDRLGGMTPSAVDSAAWARAAVFVAGPDAVSEATLGALGELTTWDAQLAFAQALPWRARPIDVHDLLVALLVELRLGAAATDLVWSHMSWPLQDADLAARFAQLAGKEGEIPGTLVATALARLAGGDRVVVVLSVHGMDLDTWMSVREASEYQALALQLVEDPEFATALREALER